MGNWENIRKTISSTWTISPKERWNWPDIITEKNPNIPLSKTPSNQPCSPHPPKKPQTPTKPPTQATSSLKSCSSISKTAIVLNCLKTRHWHYWTEKLECAILPTSLPRLDSLSGYPVGTLSEAAFCSELRKTVWRYQNGFLSKENKSL